MNSYIEEMFISLQKSLERDVREFTSQVHSHELGMVSAKVQLADRLDKLDAVKEMLNG